MKTKTSFTLNQRIKAATIVFAVMAAVNITLLTAFKMHGQEITFSTAAGAPLLTGLTLGGLVALTMNTAKCSIQLTLWILTSIASAAAFICATSMIFF
ncbi:hypothetical protein CATYP_02290 [Corynebacterium atypicum]|uniref:Uncharacterized protein n=1 Tax=Corynebacterium atypicum TaxID=191610 RepID=A0ABN4DC26_9CORY|nr:hypothetical protein [Corynebacterium atypicum]AIG63703.1 hypothetical protein CATYP_02290 [Corynebacterium atypicum]